MKFRVIELTAASEVKAKAAQAFVAVPSREWIELGNDEVGFLEGRFTDHQRGIFMQGGLINPGWKGYLTIELLIFGEVDIKVGQKMAHAIILQT